MLLSTFSNIFQPHHFKNTNANKSLRQWESTYELVENFDSYFAMLNDIKCIGREMKCTYEHFGFIEPF